MMPTTRTQRRRRTGWRDVYTTGEVVDLLGWSRSTTIRRMNSGVLPSFRVPGTRSRRVARLDLVEWIAGRPEYHFAWARLRELDGEGG